MYCLQVVGGITWCIQNCAVDIDVDLLYQVHLQMFLKKEKLQNYQQYRLPQLDQLFPSSWQLCSTTTTLWFLNSPTFVCFKARSENHTNNFSSKLNFASLSWAMSGMTAKSFYLPFKPQIHLLKCGVYNTGTVKIHEMAQHFDTVSHFILHRISNGKSSIVEERLYSFFFTFFHKKTKLRFFVFPLLHN